MRDFLIIAAISLGLSCGPPFRGTGECCTPVTVQRGFGYVGTYLGDGGVSTQVQLIVTASGEAQVSFVRGGEQIVQTFSRVSVR